MLTVKNRGTWYPYNVDDFLQSDPSFLRIAKELYKESFKEYLEEAQEESEKQLTFNDYVDDCLLPDLDVMLEVLEVYAKEQGWKACYVEAYMEENEDWFTVHLVQVIPETKDDLRELIEVYMENNNMSPNLAELVIDKLVGEE